MVESLAMTLVILKYRHESEWDMLVKNLLVLLIGVLCLPAMASIKAQDLHPDITIIWHEPDNYRDVEATNGIDSKYLTRVLTDFEKFFHKELVNYLKPKQSIKVTVFDIDLAGDIRPMLIQGSDVRLVSSMYPPMMDLEYQVLGHDGSIIKKSRKRLKDLAFNFSSSISSNTALRYEKAMLQRWFKKELRH